MTKPLLLLDVDGVLNPFAASRRWLDKSDYRKRNTTVANGKTYSVWLNRDHGRALLTMAGMYDLELVWCTDWQHEANQFISPRLGLPILPVIEYAPNGKWWKFGAALEYAESRPLAWLDDSFTLHPGGLEWFKAERSGLSTLIQEIDPHHGLREGDFQTIKTWALERK